MPFILSIVGIALLIYILLLCPVAITADLNREPEFILKYLFFKFRLYPTKKKEKKKTKKSDAQDHKEKDAKPKKKEKPKGVSYYIEKYGDAVKSVISSLGKLLRHLKINRFELSVTVGGEDAATIAIEYGAVCAVAYPIVSLLESNVEIKERSVSINTDFDAKTSNGALFADLRIKAFHVLAAVFGLASKIIKFLK